MFILREKKNYLLTLKSDSGSENEMFYTPPESPSAFTDSDDSFEDCDSNFKNYILG